jgi:hypothetical protein
MLALAHHYDEPVVGSDGVTYRARVYGGADTSGQWGGWILFFPIGGGRVISTAQETTQSNLANIDYWASGLTHVYLIGALSRALALEPDVALQRELTRLQRLESPAERAPTEERLLATVAGSAETEAEMHEAAVRVSRTTARAADRALHARSRRTASKSTASKKKK